MPALARPFTSGTTFNANSTAESGIISIANSFTFCIDSSSLPLC
ncbi:MAG: hypothetical protein R6U32_06700 [Candidatus Woesearchaeota archaeon]